MDNVIMMMIAGFIFLLVVIAFPIRRYVNPRHATRKNRSTVNSSYADNHFNEDRKVKNTHFFKEKETVEIEFEPPLLDDTLDIVEETPLPKGEPPPRKNTSAKRTDNAELILVLYVIAEGKQSFAGVDILSVLEELGLKYGEMKIFHHYGVGELKVRKAIFSVANVAEPGIFSLRQIEQFTTHGLAFFMRLPGPFGGRVAFELMLNTTYRVAEILNGHVEDERHQLLVPEVIDTLRERIAKFEKR
jgi:cell division protein ZipA